MRRNKKTEHQHRFPLHTLEPEHTTVRRIAYSWEFAYTSIPTKGYIKSIE